MRLAIIFLIVSFTQLPTAYAHHSFATHYSYEEQVKITGVITKFRLANPHSFLNVKVTLENGQSEMWEVEANSIPLLRRAGITKETFLVGEHVTITGMRSRYPDRRLMFGMVGETEEGEEYYFIRPDWDKAAPPITLVRGGTSSLALDQLAGIWKRVIRDGEIMNASGDSPLPLNEKGLQARAAYNPLESQFKDCTSPDIPSMLYIPYLIEIEINNDRIDMRHEYYDVLRQFIADGKPRPVHVTDQYGISVTRVVGNELVITSEGYPPMQAGLASDFGPLGRGKNIPSSKHKRITERYRLINNNEILEVSLLIDDPEYLTDPYETTLLWSRAPAGMELIEFECELDIARKSTSNAFSN